MTCILCLFRWILPASLLEPITPPSPICTADCPVQLHTPSEDVPRRGERPALPGGEGEREGQRARARAIERGAETAQRGGPDTGRQERGGPQGEER